MQQQQVTKSVRQILHNELRLTSEALAECIKNEVEVQVAKMLEGDQIKKFIADYVLAATDKYLRKSSDGRQSSDSIIRDEIRNQVATGMSPLIDQILSTLNKG